MVITPMHNQDQELRWTVMHQFYLGVAASPDTTDLDTAFTEFVECYYLDSRALLDLKP